MSTTLSTSSGIAVEDIPRRVAPERNLPPQPVMQRNLAVDAYRGLVMMLMMGEVLSFTRVHLAVPTSWFWSILSFNQSHVEWAGCSLHDTIQPGFSFLVGVALPYSIAARLRKGDPFGKMFAHALWRSLILVALGVFLRSIDKPQTYFTFEDTLSQIGFGYPFLFLLGFRPAKWQWWAFGLILGGYWLAWALYPAPGSGYNYPAVGVPMNWSHNFTGFASHWNKNSNLGNAFDQWFLNLFPRTRPFVDNDGGYLTLSFVPTLATMILGLVAGRWYRTYAPKIPLKRFLIAGLIGIAAGLFLHFTGICPVVKRIWTPAWVLFSGGVCFLFLAAFSWIIDIKGYRRWAFFLIVVGMNSIAAYLIAHLFERFIASSLHTHLGDRIFQVFGTAYQPFLFGSAILLIDWLILLWMHHRKIFLRI